MRIVAVIIGLSVLAFSLGAQVADSPDIISPRIAALGGPHAASTASLDAFFENPANFAQPDRSIMVSRLSVHMAGPIIDITDALIQGSFDPAELLSLLTDKKGRFYINSDIVGPISFAWVGDGLGLGIFNRTAVKMDIKSLGSAVLSVYEEILLSGGYAHRFRLGGHNLDIGFSAKAFLRNGFFLNDNPFTIIADLMDGFDDFESIDENWEYSSISGFGLDAGVLWSTPIGVDIGLAGRNIYTPVLTNVYSSFKGFREDPGAERVSGPNASLVKPDLAIGFAYTLPFDFLYDIGTEIRIFADYSNIIDLFGAMPRNMLLNFGLGIEATLMEVLTLRFGFAETLPSAGLALDFGLFKAAMAVYGKELGLEPGSRSVYNLNISIDFVY